MDFIKNIKTIQELRLMPDHAFIAYLGDVVFTFVQSRYLDNNQVARTVFEQDCWNVLCARCDMGESENYTEDEIINKYKIRPLAKKYRPDIKNISRISSLSLARAQELIIFISNIREFAPSATTFANRVQALDADTAKLLESLDNQNSPPVVPGNTKRSGLKP